MPEPDEAGEWLALMQHFGAPTRLLDVTRSPYVALYFAVEDQSAVTRSAVYAFHRNWLIVGAGKRLFADDPEKRQKAESHTAEMRRIWGSAPTPEEFAVAGYLRFEGNWLSWKVPFVLPYTPKRFAPRVAVQQGSFLVPVDVDQPFEDLLNGMPDSEGQLLKFTFPHSERPRILERLRIMKFTREQLFPGLEGFAQSLRQYLFVESAEEKRNRLALADLQAQVRSEPLRPSGSPLIAISDTPLPLRVATNKPDES